MGYFIMYAVVVSFAFGADDREVRKISRYMAIGIPIAALLWFIFNG